MDKKSIGVFTSFKGYDPAYSLNLVAETQVKMLLDGGYVPVVVVEKGFVPQGNYALEGVVIEEVTPVTASNAGQLPPNYQEEVEKLAKDYSDVISRHGLRTIITHDFISQPASLIHNLAGRKAGEVNPNVFWLHWIHSVFSANVESNVLEVSKIGRSKWKNSKIVFPNQYDIPRVARNFGVEEPDVLHCPHPVDVCGFFDFDPDLAEMVNERSVLDKEVIMVYPCRLDRGKQPHHIIEVAAALKKLGTSVAFICADFASTGGDKVTYRNEMKARARELGLDETDVIFLSETHKKFEYNAPRKVMMNLFSIANVFIMPSRSETYSLVTQEAALSGNFLILNHDFFPFRSIFGDSPKYFRFSANIGLDGYDGETEVTYSDPEGYYAAIAHYIRYVIKHNPVVRMRTHARKNRSLRAVFRNYLEPMLYGDAS